MPEDVGDGPAVAGQDGRAGVDLGEEQGEGAGDAGLAGPVQRHGDALGRVGDGAAEPADDRFPCDGPVLVVVLEVGVEVSGKVVLGVGGQQPQGQLQAAPVDVQDRPGRGRVDLAGGQLGAVLFAFGLCGFQFLLAGCDLLLRADQHAVLGGCRDRGVGQQFRQSGLGVGQRGLRGSLGFPGGDVGRVGFRLGVDHLIGGVVGEHAGTVAGHVVLEHVLLGPPAAQPAGQLGGARVEPAADGLGGHLPVLEQGQLPDRLGVVLQGDLLVGPGHLPHAAAAQGDGLRDGEQRGDCQGGAARSASRTRRRPPR